MKKIDTFEQRSTNVSINVSRRLHDRHPSHRVSRVLSGKLSDIRSRSIRSDAATVLRAAIFQFCQGTREKDRHRLLKTCVFPSPFALCPPSFVQRLLRQLLLRSSEIGDSQFPRFFRALSVSSFDIVSARRNNDTVLRNCTLHFCPRRFISAILLILPSVEQNSALTI